MAVVERYDRMFEKKKFCDWLDLVEYSETSVKRTPLGPSQVSA